VVIGNREYFYESQLERDFIYVCLASRLVKDYFDQPPRVTIMWEDGRMGEHTFDGLVTLTNGSRAAVDVKPKCRIRHSRVREIHRLVEEQVGTAFADVYLLRSEDHIHPDDVHDAKVLLRARQFACATSDAAIARLVGRLYGWCRLRDLVAASGLGADGFNAAVRLIGDGVLEVRDCDPISYECFVRRTRA